MRHLGKALADADKIPSRGEIIDRAAVILSVDDGRRLGRKPGEILRDGDAAEVGIAEKRVFSVMGVTTLPARISCEATSKMRRCTSSKKWSGLSVRSPTRRRRRRC